MERADCEGGLVTTKPAVVLSKDVESNKADRTNLKVIGLCAVADDGEDFESTNEKFISLYQYRVYTVRSRQRHVVTNSRQTNDDTRDWGRREDGDIPSVCARSSHLAKAGEAEGTAHTSSIAHLARNTQNLQTPVSRQTLRGDGTDRREKTAEPDCGCEGRRAGLWLWLWRTHDDPKLSRNPRRRTCRVGTHA